MKITGEQLQGMITETRNFTPTESTTVSLLAQRIDEGRNPLGFVMEFVSLVEDSRRGTTPDGELMPHAVARKDEHVYMSLFDLVVDVAHATAGLEFAREATNLYFSYQDSLVQKSA